MGQQLERPEPTEPQAKAAWEVEQRIRKVIRLLNTGWVHLAKDLYRFVDQAMWRDLGYPSFEQWLAEPNIELERRQVYYLLEAWRELVVNRGTDPRLLEGVGVSKVSEILPAIRRGFVEVEEALADCHELARDDLRERYRGLKPDTGPGIDPSREPQYAICQVCGQRYKVKEAA